MKRVTLPSSARPSTSKRCAGTMAVGCGVRPSMLGTWCSTSSRATRAAISSICRGRDYTSSWRCFDRAPTISRPSTAKFSSIPRTLNSYIAFTPSLCMYLRKLRMMFLKRDASLGGLRKMECSSIKVKSKERHKITSRTLRHSLWTFGSRKSRRGLGVPTVGSPDLWCQNSWRLPT